MLLNLVYLLALIVLSPWLVWRSRLDRPLSPGVVREAPRQRDCSQSEQEAVAWFHAVSVGEVNLLGTLVPAFRKRHPDWLVVVSSTTDTGLAEARKHFADLAVIAVAVRLLLGRRRRARCREAGARGAHRERAVAELPRRGEAAQRAGVVSSTPG